MAPCRQGGGERVHKMDSKTWIKQRKVGAGQIFAEMQVPNGCVGLIIGKAGSTIKQLSEDSGAFIQTARDHEVAPGSQERDVFIVGSEDQITVAKQLISQLVSGAQDVSRGRGGGGPGRGGFGIPRGGGGGFPPPALASNQLLQMPYLPHMELQPVAPPAGGAGQPPPPKRGKWDQAAA
jgi:hypothetical protein